MKIAVIGRRLPLFFSKMKKFFENSHNIWLHFT
nr:MAG TPA: hypothetical protein [Bacteriophage sp.]